MPDEIDLLRMFRDEMPGPTTDAWARARAAIAAARSEELPARGIRLGRRGMPIIAVGTMAAAVAGLVAALLTGQPAGRPAGQLQTTAFVTRVEQAVNRASAGPRQGNVVGYARTVLPAGSRLHLGVGNFAAGPGVTGLAVDVTVTRSYQGTSTTSGFTRGGRLVFASETTTGRGGETKEVTVIYGNATWWRATVRPSSAGPPPVQPSCGPGLLIGPGGWPAFIRYELHCGVFLPAGRQRSIRMGTIEPGRQLDGVATVKLTGRNGIVLWVNAATYLPVRVLANGREPTQIDFRWLPPAPGNLAGLSVPVPAGFRQVPPP